MSASIIIKFIGPTQQIQALEEGKKVLKWQMLIQNRGGLPLDSNYHYTVGSIKGNQYEETVKVFIKGNQDEETIKGTIIKDTKNS